MLEINWGTGSKISSGKGKEPFAPGQLGTQHFQKDTQAALQIPAIDYEVQKAMLQHKLCTLKSSRKVLANRFTNDPGPGKTYQRAWFCDIKVSQHGIGSCDTTGSRIG